MITLAIVADATIIILRDLIVPALLVAAVVLRVRRRFAQSSSDERPAA